MVDPVRRAFVCGHPVAHSRSPLIHTYWLQSLGLSGTYERVDILTADFETFLSDLSKKGFVGGNITLPHKEAAFVIAERKDRAAEIIGAVNTVWLADGMIHAANTDAAGFAANLDERAPEWRRARTAVVLGAGGAARAILYALQEAGIRDIRIVNRTTVRAAGLTERFAPGPTAHEWVELPVLLRDTELLVNTTSLGMHGHAELDIDLYPLPPKAIVTDIVYVPLETAILRKARLRGLTAVDGLGMLLHQAVPGFTRWFGVRPAVTDALRNLIIADLESGH